MTTATKFSQLTGDYVLDTAHARIGFVAARLTGGMVIFVGERLGPSRVLAAS